jgi:hypothetical protein
MVVEEEAAAADQVEVVGCYLAVVGARPGNKPAQSAAESRKNYGKSFVLSPTCIHHRTVRVPTIFSEVSAGAWKKTATGGPVALEHSNIQLQWSHLSSAFDPAQC